MSTVFAKVGAGDRSPAVRWDAELRTKEVGMSLSHPLTWGPRTSLELQLVFLQHATTLIGILLELQLLALKQTLRSTGTGEQNYKWMIYSDTQLATFLRVSPGIRMGYGGL